MSIEITFQVPQHSDQSLTFVEAWALQQHLMKIQSAYIVAGVMHIIAGYKRVKKGLAVELAKDFTEFDEDQF